MARKNPEPEETRERIRACAAMLFMANGIHATSLFDIAQAAALSKGTLFYHYPTKEDLVLAIAEEHFSYFTACIFNWIEDLDVNQSVATLLAPLTSALTGNHDVMRLHFAFLSEALREQGSLRTLLGTKRREWGVMIEVGALKMAGPGAKRFRAYCREYLALIDGGALNMLLNDDTDCAFIDTLLTAE